MKNLFRSLMACFLFGAAASPVLAQGDNTGIYLGIWANPLGLHPISEDKEEQAIELREGGAPLGINRTFALHLHYYGWTALAPLLDNNGVFHPDAALQFDIDHGRVPVISWVCDGGPFNSDGKIASGDPGEDAIIIATAKALAQYPGTVLLRWFWEFNVLVNNQNCRGDAGGTPTPSIYIDFVAAWRHIRELFHQAGARNVLFLWNPGHYPLSGAPDDPHSFYPGNGFVDWIGIDTYQRSPSQTFTDNFGLFYSDFSQDQYAHKPLMVGENGSFAHTSNNGELQATYLEGLLADVRAGLYPQLQAYCYFDSVGSSGDDYILDDNNGSGNGGLAAFSVIGAAPEFSALPDLSFPR